MKWETGQYPRLQLINEPQVLAGSNAEPAGVRASDGLGPQATFLHPATLAVDATSATLYVFDAGSFTLRAVRLGAGPARGTVTTLAGDGQVRAASARAS